MLKSIKPIKTYTVETWPKRSKREKICKPQKENTVSGKKTKIVIQWTHDEIN